MDTEFKYSRERGLRYKFTYWTSEHGRSSCRIECPHCGTKFKAYLWSLAGSGKKCPKCGALHTWIEQLSYPLT